MSVIAQLDAIQSRHEPTWLNGYRFFPSILENHQCKRGVEVGVAFGGHSEAILRETNVQKLYGVDAYLHRVGYEDAMNLPQPVFDALCARTISRLGVFGERFELIRQDSAEAARAVTEPLDFVYLDADHSYEGVVRDLAAWFRKLQPGGILGGHDYGHPTFPGVKQAVDEFVRRFGWKVNVEGEGVWWVQTGPIHISYIVPAYNCETTLAETVSSIADGNMQPEDEIVVVDDCSTDGTAAVIAELAAKYPMLRTQRHLRNKGGAATRNTAVEISRHALIFCLDSDNVLMPRSVPGLKDFLIDNGADVAAFQNIDFFEQPNKDLTSQWKYKPGLFTLADCLKTIKAPGASGNYLYTKESWLRAGAYPEFAGALDTWGFGFRQLATGSKMMVMPDTAYLHRQGHDSYWIRQDRAGDTGLRALQVMLPFLSLINERDVRYILSARGRNRWHTALDNHPLRLRRPKTQKSVRDALRSLKRFVKQRLLRR